MHAGMLLPYVDQIVCTDLRRYCAEYEGQFPKLLKEKFERHGHALDLAKLELHFANAMELPYRDGWFDCHFVQCVRAHSRSTTRIAGDDPRRRARRVYLRHLRSAVDGRLGQSLLADGEEPWAHLILSEDAFKARMKRREPPSSSSRIQRRDESPPTRVLRQLFADPAVAAATTLKRHDRWEGVSDAAHQTHENYTLAIKHGYSRSELMARGMRVVLQKK